MVLTIINYYEKEVVFKNEQEAKNMKSNYCYHHLHVWLINVTTAKWNFCFRLFSIVSHYYLDLVACLLLSTFHIQNIVLYSGTDLWVWNELRSLSNATANRKLMQPLSFVKNIMAADDEKSIINLSHSNRHFSIDWFSGNSDTTNWIYLIESQLKLKQCTYCPTIPKWV